MQQYTKYRPIIDRLHVYTLQCLHQIQMLCRAAPYMFSFVVLRSDINV